MKFTPPIQQISSLNDLNIVINSVQEYRMYNSINGHNVSELYRGQGQDWPLRPTIVRNLKTPEEARQIEEAMITEFHQILKENGLEKSLQGEFLTGTYHTQWLLLQQAQHYGLPTRCMDWTINWEIALYFAVFNPNDDHKNAVFWIYTVPENGLTFDGNKPGYLDYNPFEFKETIFLNPSGFASKDYNSQIAERRRLRQNGRFCIQDYENIFIPLEEHPAHQPNLHKITIPKEIKSELREHLASKNFTESIIYVEKNEQIDEIVASLRSKYKV